MKRSDIYTLMEARCLPTEAMWSSETNMGDGQRFSPKQSHNQVPMMHPSPTPHSNHPTCVNTSDAEAAVCCMCKTCSDWQETLWRTCMKGARLSHLGTDRSPLVLFAGLQRSFTTALRPDWQDEVASRDLNSKMTEIKRGTLGHSLFQI